MRSMVSYTKAAMERAVQEVILRAMAKRITWCATHIHTIHTIKAKRRDIHSGYGGESLNCGSKASGVVGVVYRNLFNFVRRYEKQISRIPLFPPVFPFRLSHAQELPAETR